MFKTKQNMTLNKFVPCIFTTHWIDHFNKFTTHNLADLDTKKVMFESVKPDYRKKIFLKKISFTFLMLYIINIDSQNWSNVMKILDSQQAQII